MRRPKPIFAIAYDFDGTLAPGNMQEHSFIPALGHKKATDFWARSNEDAVKSQGDPILLYMRHMLEGAHHAEVKVDRASLRDHGATILLFPGVEDWLPASLPRARRAASTSSTSSSPRACATSSRARPSGSTSRRSSPRASSTTSTTLPSPRRWP